jgi:hypothetical protein
MTGGVRLSGEEPSRGEVRECPGPAGRGWWQRHVGAVALVLTVFVVHGLSPSVQIGDSRLSAVTAWRFLTHFDLHLQDYPSVARLSDTYDEVFVAGNTLPYFPWPTMLLAIPAGVLFLVTGRAVPSLSIANPSQTFLIEIPTASWIVALTALVLREVIVSLPGLRISPRAAMLSALVFGFGTSAWSVGSRALWQQTASMLFLSLALLCLVRLGRSRAWEWALGACLALAMTTRPTDAVIVALFIAWIVMCARFAALRAAGTFAATVGLFCAFSYSQYGTIIPPYYLPGRLAGDHAIPLLESLGLNLISPSRGLIVFNPVFVLGLAGIVVRVRKGCLTSLDLVLCASVVLQWLVIATFGSTGGTVYGPRLMVDVIPFLVVLAAPALQVLVEPAPRDAQRRWPRRLVVVGVAVVVVWSVFVNATGALLRDSRCWSVLPTSVDAEPGRIWDWSDPQFLRPYRDLLDGRSLGWVLRGSCVPE